MWSSQPVSVALLSRILPSSFTQTSRGPSHWCERSAVREQYHALECCYFWVSQAVKQLLRPLPAVIDRSLMEHCFAASDCSCCQKCDWLTSLFLSALCRPVGTPFEDGKLSRKSLPLYLLLQVPCCLLRQDKCWLRLYCFPSSIRADISPSMPCFFLPVCILSSMIVYPNFFILPKRSSILFPKQNGGQVLIGSLSLTPQGHLSSW